MKTVIKDIWMLRIAMAVWTIASIAFLVLLVSMALGVQPMPGGMRLTWDRATNDLSFSVWRTFARDTNWFFVANMTNTTYLYTNAVQEGSMFGVTALQRMSNGACCVATDVGVAHWPPAVATPPKTVRLTPTNGFLVATGQWVKVSSDMATFDDWLRFSLGNGSNGIKVEHRASPLKPRLYMEYPTNALEAPMPGGKP